jgi:hypothetical protein
MDELDPLFRQLIQRTRVLATVCDNAATVLSEEFEDMVLGPLAAVQEVLAQCPDVTPWDGSFNEDDITVRVFRHEAQRVDIPPASVMVTHLPSGMSVESYSKSTREENEAVALRALHDRVRYKWEAQQ